MTRFHDSLNAWPSDLFTGVLKSEIEALNAGVLPLDKSTTQGGMVDDSHITATILNIADDDKTITAKTGIFFTEIVGGCNCNDDPQPTNVYCELFVSINKQTADTSFEIISD